MTKAKGLAILTFLLCGAATPAKADPTKADDRYGYVFNDDLLAAGGGGPLAVPIRVQKHLHRELLLRPRVQFVTQMLKSVEAL
jgi:hypothetical protein